MIEITNTIVLKPISLDDVPYIFDTINKERTYLRQWLPFVDTTKEESDTFVFVQNVIEHSEVQYSIYDDGNFIGLIGFKDIDTINAKAEIGYWLSEKAQGKGIMTKSVKELLLLAFSDLGLNRIQIKVAVENKNSRKIPERLGFSLEGIERDGELLVDNKYTDIVIYSLLKREFTI